MTNIVTSAVQLKPSQAKSCITKALKAKLVPILHGSPAIGKSSIVHAVAEQFNLKVIDLRLSQCEPTDMLGFPYIDKERNKAGYTPMDTFPIEGDELPVKTWVDALVAGNKVKAPETYYDGWLLFLDEITSASPAVQAAAYKLILDRMVGQYNLHKKVVIVGAGNLETDNAVVAPMSTALKSRLIHLELRLDMKEWIDWGIDHDIDYRILNFVQFKPDSLYTFDPNTSDKTYAAPRTWEFTNRALKVCEGNVEDTDFFYLASGAITEGVTREFISFCTLYDQLPKIADILKDPLYMDIPKEPGIRYALTGSIGTHLDLDNASTLMQYIMRMPEEFQVITLRYAIKKNKELIRSPEITKWAAKFGSMMF